MSSLSTATTGATGCIVLMLGGAVFAVVGLAVFASGLWATVSGSGSGHVGGWELLGYGALLGLGGFWAIKRGRRGYASRENVA
jgi:hypothetical protein